ncbi:unnamed protein product [Didymodactylos carnosus]|uniref:Uncharacterized protein n=1 Tax=Didymodactylos carnosus TaxID=1234261 RepID=A0A814E334_9BILA|nr:unnamed protein product [Didymodactylos carnosus]CAF3735333.1 unnamed protein product [Didymodactylos carnosus]
MHLYIVNHSDSESNIETVNESDESNESEDDSFILNSFNDHIITVDDRPLHAYTNRTVKEYSEKMLAFMRKLRMAKSQTDELLKLVNDFSPTPNNSPTTSIKLCNSLDLTSNHQTYKFCSNCLNELKHGQCINNNCQFLNEKLNIGQTIDLCLTNLKYVLERIVKSNYNLLLNYQKTARLKQNNLTDITSPIQYQKLLMKNENFFISLLLHGDGIPLYKSRHRPAWPINAIILELPPYARSSRKNVILLGRDVIRSFSMFFNIFNLFS